MAQTLAYYATAFYRSFVAYTTGRLQALGLSYGLLFFVIYVGKHPGCTQAELTAALKLDWGYSQRSIGKLVEDGFLLREKRGRAYHLELQEKGKQAFSVGHQVFEDWDAEHLSGFTKEEKMQLMELLAKAFHEKGAENHV